MQFEKFGLALYRIFASIISGLIILFHFYIFIDLLKFDRCLDFDFGQTIKETKDFIWLILFFSFFIGEIFSFLGEFILFSLFMRSYGSIEVITLYTKWFYINSKFKFSYLTFKELNEGLSTDKPLAHFAEICYGLARATAGLSLYLFAMFLVCYVYFYFKNIFTTEIDFEFLTTIFMIMLAFLSVFIIIPSFWEEIKSLIEKIIEKIKQIIIIEKIKQKIWFRNIILIFLILLFIFYITKGKLLPYVLIIFFIILILLNFFSSFLTLPYLLLYFFLKNLECTAKSFVMYIQFLLSLLFILVYIIFVIYSIYTLINLYRKKSYIAITLYLITIIILIFIYFIELFSLKVNSRAIILEIIQYPILQQSNQKLSDNIDNKPTKSSKDENQTENKSCYNNQNRNRLNNSSTHDFNLNIQVNFYTNNIKNFSITFNQSTNDSLMSNIYIPNSSNLSTSSDKHKYFNFNNTQNTTNSNIKRCSTEKTNNKLNNKCIYAMVAFLSFTFYISTGCLLLSVLFKSSSNKTIKTLVESEKS